MLSRNTSTTCNTATFVTCMGVDHGGISPPEFGVRDASANCPPIFCHTGTKRSVLWHSNTPKSVSGRGSAPDPAGGTHDAPPDPLVGWGGDTPPHTLSHSAPTHLRRLPCVPRNSCQIYAYGNLSSTSLSSYCSCCCCCCMSNNI